MRRFLEIIWTVAKLGLIAGIVFLGSCTTTRTILKQAPTETLSGWTADPYLPMPPERARALLAATYYGPVDLDPDVEILSYEVLDDRALDGRATLHQWRLSIGFGGPARPVDLVALLPNDEQNAPLILSQNFCPNHNVVPLPGVRAPSSMGFDCSGGGIAGWAMTNLFGRYIVKSPIGDIIDRGYGFAALYPSQYIPDRGDSGLQTLETLFQDRERPGALSVWANLVPVAATVIEQRVGERSVIAYGHSRFGKTALIAGAWFDEIDGVIAHQSGTLGASALDDENGEPLDALIEGYPHWPGPGASRFADDPGALPVRPADLLALTGDKPVLLGNARRDVWSDPWDAFTEAKRAWAEEFPTKDPGDFNPTDRKAYWLRPGTHGVVKEDWPAFLDFLDAHFGADE